MKTSQPLAVPLLAQLSVKLPSVKSQDKETRPHRDTRCTLVANETTDDD